MIEKINPYIAGAPVVEERMFFGREGVFTWIEHELAGSEVDHILVMHGQRRVGKTSVLKHLPKRLPEEYIFVFIDLQGRISTSLGRLLGWLGREIFRALREQGIELAEPDREAFVGDPDYFEQVFIPNAEQGLGENRLLLAFDEFDVLQNVASQEELVLPFLAILRRLMEHDKIGFIFSVGSSGRKLEHMKAAYTGFFKQALYQKISFLEIEDACELIVEPVKGVMTYASSAVDRIIEVTSGHPYFIQLVCHELFSACQKKDDWNVDLHDVLGILETVIERGTVNLKFVWDDANELEKWVLASLALFDHRTDAETLGKHLHQQGVRFTNQSLEKALINLREKDVLTQDNRFVIHLMRLWLLQNRSMEQVREELIKENPIVRRWVEIGQEYLDNQEYGRAIESFGQALEIDPNNIEVQLGLASAEMGRGDYGRAGSLYEAVLEQQGEHVVAEAGYCQAYLALGDSHLTMGYVEEAEYVYQRILNLSPRHEEANQRKAALHHSRAVMAMSEDQQGALEELAHALTRIPDNEHIRATINDLRILIGGRANRLDVLQNWAQRAMLLKYLEDAQILYEQFVNQGGEESQIADEYAEVVEQVKQVKGEGLRQQAERMEGLERWEEAIAAWRAYREINPDEQKSVTQTIARIEDTRKAAETLAMPAAKPVWRRAWLWLGVVIVGLISVLVVWPPSSLITAFAQPTGTATPTATATPTVTATPTPSSTPTVPTLTPTHTPTITSSHTPTATMTLTQTITSTPTLPEGYNLVPNVVGLPSNEGIVELNKVGFAHEIQSEYNPDVPKNQIIGQEPLADSILERGQTVIIYVATDSVIMFFSHLAPQGWEYYYVDLPDSTWCQASLMNMYIDNSFISVNLFKPDGSELPEGRVANSGPIYNEFITDQEGTYRIFVKVKRTIPVVTTEADYLIICQP